MKAKSAAPGFQNGHLSIEERKQWREERPSTTMGDPDGPMRYIESLEEEVGTFIDPRMDLLGENQMRMYKIFKRLDYHIPLKKRGIYRPEWLPEAWRAKLVARGELKVDYEGWVLCNGFATWQPRTGKKIEGGNRPCQKRAVNRCGFCGLHGGTLHPADKKMSARTFGNIPMDRVEKLDRVQKFMQGFLKMEDLTDEEVIGAFVFNDEGRPVASTRLGNRLHQQITQELFRRMNRFMQMKLPNMLKTMIDIAESDIVEPADRIKAAQWIAERVMGKTPDVLVLGKTEAPYETILEGIDAGSRDSYRNGQKEIVGQNGIVGANVDDYIRESVPELGMGLSGSVGGVGEGSGVVIDGEVGSDEVGDESDLARVQREKDEIKAARNRVKQAKSRRYAARAAGATLDGGNGPWEVETQPISDVDVLVGLVRDGYTGSLAYMVRIGKSDWSVT